MLKTIRVPLIFMLALALAPLPVLAAPQFGPITPPDGTVVTAVEVTLDGTVSGATSLEVLNDACVVTFGGSSFSVACALPEGITSFILIAGDDQGGETQQIHQIERDTRPPLLNASQPVPGAVLANPTVTVAGTVVDPNLDAVLVTPAVGGTLPAAVIGASFSLDVPLAPGPQTIVLTANDTLGHQSQDSVDVTYDPELPTIAVTANGVALVSGAEFDQPVVVLVSTDDNVGVASTEILVDSDLFSSGDTVADEGAHTLEVTVTDVAGNVSQVTAGFVLDFTPPTIGAVTPPDGSLTAATEVTLVGEVEDATAVTVDGSAVSLGAGSFTAGPYSLTDGAERTFTIVAFDAAGNDTTRLHRIERDSSPPDITGLSPADGTEVAVASIAVSGTAGDMHLAEVRVAGELANLTGNDFSVPAVPLSEGANPITVTATDAAGNSSQEQVTVVRDTLPPEIQVDAGGAPLLDGAAFAGPVTVVIQATDTTAVTTMATLNGAPFTSGSTVTGDDEYQLSVVATDALDHSTSLELAFVIDTAPPEILFVAPPEGELTSATEVVISGQVNAADAVTVNTQPAELTGIAFTTDTNPLSLTEGDNLFTVVATDLSGNSDQVVRRVVRDTTAPELTIGQPPPDAVVKTTTIDVSGSVSDTHLASVTVNEMEATVTGTGFAAFLVPLSEGANELEVVAEDEVGLSTTRTRSIVLDTEVPTLAITDPAPGTVVPDGEIVLRGTADDAHLDRVEVDGRPAQLAGGDWSITVDLEPGTNDFTALAYDTLGQVSDPETLMVFRDSEAPTIQIEQPAEGLITMASSVQVSGTVEEEEEIVVTVNGVEVTADSGAFTSTVDLVEEGENRIIARATDAQGNQGTHTRLVVRDTTPPQWLSAEPADGALAVPTNAVFRLTFSETLAAPVAGAWSLETAGGVEIAATAAVDGDELAVTPSSPLPSQTDIRLVLTAAVADPAGNPLTAPPILSFTTSDTGAPGAPVLDPTPPLYQCVAEAALAGTTEPDAVVRVTGGAATVSTRAGVDGAFALTVPLVPDLLNHLAVVAVDLNGNPSPTTFADVVQDCEAPRVEGAERDGDMLTITFSEAVESATVAPAVTVTDAGGGIAGSVAVMSSTATFTADQPLPAEGVRLEVEDTVTDLAGNALAYPFSRVFGEGTGESFFSGTVIDESTGRPLAGARVEVTASGGVALPEPRPLQVTGDDGRFLIAIAAGDHDVTFARPGYTPALRNVTTAAGQGTEVFDPRLTPDEAVATVAAAGGTVSGDGGLELVVPAGALAAAGEVRLTVLDAQGLPAMLPYGWSPRGAVWLDLPAVLQVPADLSFPVESPDGTVLTLAELDLATLEWRTLAAVTVTGGAVDAQVTALGAVAALEADAGPLAPPPALDGEVLGASAPPVGDEITGATLTFDPAVVLPAQRSRATAIFELAAEAPSGVPVTLLVQEELELLDGSLRRESPYRADVVIYRALDGATPVVRFWLQPSSEARRQPVRLGAEEVEILAYGDASVRGNVLGTDGGSVSNDEGDSIDVPPGALDEPAAVVLHRRQAADMPLQPPAGVTIDAVVEVDLGGRQLAAPAALSAALSPPPAAGEKGILLHFAEVAGLAVYRAAAEIEPTAGGWATVMIDPLDLPWPGVTSGGFYAFARLSAPHGFLRGTVHDAGGAPLAGAVVTSASVEWIQLSNPDGSYVLPLPVGSATVDVLHPQNGNAVSFSVDVTAGGERVEHHPTLQVVAPEVVNTTPADGAVEQLIGIQPAVRFSESVDRQSLAAGIELKLDGQPVAVDFIHQSDLVTVVPGASLLPGRTYELRITSAVLDLDGYMLTSPLTVSFTTQTVVLPDEIDPSRITLYEPDAAGLARVVGLPGATPAEHTVWVENLTSPAAIPTTTTGQDGSFELTIDSGIDDLLMLNLLVDGGNQVQFPLGPFVGVDRRAVWVGAEAREFTTADGVTLMIDEDTFVGMARVSFEPLSITEPPPAPAPVDLETVYAFELDFGGAQARKAVHFRLPATAETPDNVFLLNRLIDVPGGQAWMMHDLMWRDGDHLTTEDADVLDPPDSVPEEETVLLLTGADGESGSRMEVKQLAPRITDKSHIRPPVTYKRYVPGMVLPGTYHISNPLEELFGFVLPVAPNFLFRAFALGFEGLVTRINQALSQFLQADGVMMMGHLNRQFELEIRELSTDYLIFSGSFDPPAEGGLVALPPDVWGDVVAPVPVGGSPVRFFQILFSPRSVNGEFDTGISYRFDYDDRAVIIEGEPGSTHPGAEIRWYNVDHEVVEPSEPPQEEPITTSISSAGDGSFLLTATARPERRYVMAIGAEIAGDEPLEIRFSEGLADSAFFDSGGEIPNVPLPFDVRDENSQRVHFVTTPVESTSVVRVAPFTGWLAGKSYTLVLGPDLADPLGNAWEETFSIDFEVDAGQVLDTESFEAVRESARLGSLLFVAGNHDGLLIFDVSDPQEIVPYVYRMVGEGSTATREPRGLPFPFSDAVRGVDVDAHGRVIVVGGGTASFGQLKILDPQALDPEAIAADPDNLEVLFAAYKGSTVISDQLGAIGTQLPAGTPQRVAVLSNDETESWLAGEEPPYGIVVFPPELDEFTLFVAGTATPSSAVTLTNADEGGSTEEQADEDGQFELNIQAHIGDQLILTRDTGLILWRAGQRPAGDLSLSPLVEAEPFDLTVRGCAGERVPVTLRDTVRGRAQRADAYKRPHIEPGEPEIPLCDPNSPVPNTGGFFEVELEVYPGDQLELVRNKDTLAYVATLGAGVEVVDVNSFFNEATIGDPRQQNVLGIYSGFEDPNLELCGDRVSDLGGALLALDTLVDITNPFPFSIPALVAFNGLAMLGSNPNSPGQMGFISERCVQDFGNANVSGLEVLQSYPFDFDDSGSYEPTEYRDWAVITHRVAGILVLDITSRHMIEFAGRIELPGPAAALAVDREHRLLYASAYGEGLYVVDFDVVPVDDFIDVNHDGLDDRVLETISLGGNNNAPVGLYPELGLGFAGGIDRGLSTVALNGPKLVALAPSLNETRREISRVAPLGVPTGPEDPSDPFSPEQVASFHLLAYLPGFVGEEITLDVVSVGPGRLEIYPAGDPEEIVGLPRTALTGEHAVVLSRLSDNPMDEGYQIYQSREIVTLADLRAAKKFRRTEAENDGACIRCTAPEFLLTESLELLSGEFIAVRFSDDTRAELLDVYGEVRLDEAELELESVRWDISPSARQEPTLNASFGKGDVAPGTLLHSGEMSTLGLDMKIVGRGIDFAFTRTYRNQTVGAGPLGPGWDHNYNQRLRPLPNGDVEYFAGRGRRELFELQEDGRYRADGRFVELARTAAGWVIVDPRRNVTRFDRFGRLISITDPYKVSEDTGNEIRFHYDRESRLTTIVDTLDRSIDLEYDDAGRLIRLRDFTDREVTYGYDDRGRLITATSPKVEIGLSKFPDGLTTTYGYTQEFDVELAAELSHRDNLISCQDPREKIWLEISYADVDGDERRDEVDDQKWGELDRVRFDYNFDLRRTQVTDRRGVMRSYVHNEDGQVTLFTDPLDEMTRMEYIRDGLLSRLTEPLGRVTEFSYPDPVKSPDRRSQGNLEKTDVTPDARGSNSVGPEACTEEQDQECLANPDDCSCAFAVNVAQEFDSFGNLPSEIVDQRGNVLKLKRDDRGLVTRAELPGGSILDTEYNEFGQKLRETINSRPEGKTYSYYEEGPSRGYLREEVVGGIVRTRYEYDERGNITAIVDSRGVRVEHVWNEVDWLVEVRKATTGAVSDPHGQDAPALSLIHRFAFDANGNITEEHVPFGDSGQVHTVSSFEFGLLNEVTRTERELEPGGRRIVETREYDPNLNVTALVDFNGNRHTFFYDDRNLNTTTSMGDGLVVETFSYDPEHRQTTRTNGRGKTWVTAYDGKGRVKVEVDPLGNYTTYAYDDSDNMSRTQSFDVEDKLLAQTHLTFDGLGRKVALQELLIDDDNGDRQLTSTWDYDHASNLRLYTDPESRETVYDYDSAERLLQITHPDGSSRSFELDGNGNVVKTTVFEKVPGEADSEFITEATYDALNRVVATTDSFGNETRNIYDARGNVRLTVDPEGNLTTSTFDALDRLLSRTQPEGITVSHVYDDNSNLLSYSDGLENTTSYIYDGLDRPTDVTFPDGTQWKKNYDEVGNVRQATDARGTVVDQVFDDADRLITRTVSPSLGVEGVTTETISWDGLNRQVRMQSGDVIIEKTYDSVSRLTSETQLGRTVSYAYDLVGNNTRLTYPSGLELTSSYDPLDRPLTIVTDAEQQLVDYEYRGPLFRHQTSLSNGLVGKMEYDVARRLTRHEWVNAGGEEVLMEQLSWSPRSLKVGSFRGDFEKQSQVMSHDKAGRLTRAAGSSESPTDIGRTEPPVANNDVSSEGVAGPEGFDYRYDETQNMVARTERVSGVPEETALPPDDSGRNRPDSLGGIELEWDANGNLIRKGDTHYHYDFRDRLVRVSREGVGTVVEYAYDFHDRRMRKEVSGLTTEYVWSGWQSLEEYTDGQLAARRSYGSNVDEIVRADVDLDGDGALETSYVPLYDETGNLVMVTDAAGKPVEKYVYSPFGERVVLLDATPPEILQIRRTGDELWVELSEDVAPEALVAAIDEGNLVLVDDATQDALPVSVFQPLLTGRQARQRLIITTTDPPADGAALTLRFEPEALVDPFLNQPSAAFQYSFTWPASDAVLFDTAAPEILEVFVLEGHLAIELSEEVDFSSATAAILVDGQPIEWILDDNRYTLLSASPLAAGSYQIQIGGVLDLAGSGIAEPYSAAFEITETLTSFFVARKPDPRQIFASAVKNLYGFHGRPQDSETGFYYFRHRYYDPELARFITSDPYGYGDGPNVYQYGLNSPFDYSDPNGEFVSHIAAGLVSAGIGWLTAKLLGVDYTLEDAAIDFSAGALTHGLSAINKLRRFGPVAKVLIRQKAELALGMAFEAARHEWKGEDYTFGELYLQATLGQKVGDKVSQYGRRVFRGIRLPKIWTRGADAEFKYETRCPIRGNCFAAGTLIATDDGARPIEEIETGDLVWSYDEATDSQRLAEVVELFQRQVLEIWALTVGDEIIAATDEHPFWVAGRGWVEAKELTAGDLLVTQDGETLVLDGVERRNENVRVFNFEVRDLHNYYVSSYEVLVHNCRLVPGTPGVVTGGSSTKLGKNIFESLGLARGTKRAGYQAHHILPTQLKKHRVIQKIGMDLDDPSNGIFLPTKKAKPNSTVLPRHYGSHPRYTAAIERQLDGLDINASEAELVKQVGQIQKRLRRGFAAGLPVMNKEGATVGLWTRWLSR